MHRPRVLVADDHADAAEQLRSLLEPDFEVVGSVGDGRALVSAAALLSPDVIVTDISMPGLDGIEATSEIRRNDPHVRIVLVTVHAEPILVERGLAAGAAVHAALAGKCHVSPALDIHEREARPE
jgi:CheY-like chemotaxis protein